MRLPSLCALLLGLAFATAAAAQSWQSLGPPGGDVRALAADPQHSERLYLGTPDGHIFGSQDAGDSWKLLGRISSRTDSVITAILVDPRNPQRIFAAAWTRDPSAIAGGGVFRSDDAGISWRPSGLRGQAVRALAQANSDPDVLVAGTLEGVFQSRDLGATWQRISPESNAELRNIDSVAIDPRNPDVIYTGTFHLPWKTVDAGRSWSAVHRGMIDDSDVMSILPDRVQSSRVFASACSGIYRSDDGGALWQKVQGIPFSARRTHVLAQDPSRPEIIYAGTTEGLWKSADAGGSWKRLTPANWVINAVQLPAARPGRIVIGTDEMGILVSDDAGLNFHVSNDGFNHRQAIALALDPDHAGRLLAVFASGPAPVLATADGGRNWKPLGKGLPSAKILRVYASPEGWWASLSTGGLMRYDAARGIWIREGRLLGAVSQDHLADSFSARRNLKPVPAARRSRLVLDGRLNWVVRDMAFTSSRWFAASDHGLLVSESRGRSWKILSIAGVPNLPVSSVTASRDAKSVWAVSLRGIIVSSDGGNKWTWRDLPLNSGGALRLAIGREGPNAAVLVAAARNGLFISRDAGATWQQAANGLPQAPMADLAMVGDVWVASPATGGLYISNDSGRTWDRLSGTVAEGVFSAVAAQPGAASVLAASSDGVYSLQVPKTQARRAGLQGN